MASKGNMFRQLARRLTNNPGIQFWFGFLVGPLGLAILDILFGGQPPRRERRGLHLRMQRKS